MNCKYCKMEVPEGYRYCPNCGLLLDLGQKFTAPERKYTITKYEYQPKKPEEAKSAAPETTQQFLQPQHEESTEEAEARLELELRKALERDARALVAEKKPTEAVEFSDEDYARVEQDDMPDAIELEEAAPLEEAAKAEEAESAAAEAEVQAEVSGEEALSSDAEETAATVAVNAETAAEEAVEATDVTMTSDVTEVKEVQMEPIAEATEEAAEASTEEMTETEAAEETSTEEEVGAAAEIPEEPHADGPAEVEEAEASTEVEEAEQVETANAVAVEETEASTEAEEAEPTETANAVEIEEKEAEKAEETETAEATEEASTGEVAEATAEVDEAEKAETSETAAEVTGTERTEEAAEEVSEAASAEDEATETTTEVEEAEEAEEAEESVEMEPTEETMSPAFETPGMGNGAGTVTVDVTGVASEIVDVHSDLEKRIAELLPDDGLDSAKVDEQGNPAFVWDEHISFMEAVSEKFVGDFATADESKEEPAETDAPKEEVEPAVESDKRVLEPEVKDEETATADATSEPATDVPAAVENTETVESEAENETERPAELDASAEADEAAAEEIAVAEETAATEETAEADEAAETEKSVEADEVATEETAEADEAEEVEERAAEAEEAEETAKIIELYAEAESDEAEDTETEYERLNHSRGEKRGRKPKRFLIPLAVCAVAAGAVVVYLNLPAQRTSRALHKGRSYIESNNFTAAVPVLEKLLQEQPDSLEVHLLLADAYANTDQHAQAVTLLEEAKATYPDNAELLEKLAELNPTVTVSVPSGDYSDPQSITLSNEKGYEIRYQLNDAPEETYDDEILLSTNGTFTLSAYAVASDGGKGESVNMNYTIQLDPEKYSLDQFVDTADGRQYVDANGAVQTGWMTKDGKTYYFDEKGYMLTGLQTIAGSSYFFDADGVLSTGWQEQDGKRYFFDEKGQMLINTWIDNQYYVGEDGAMLTDTTTPDGVYVNSRGQRGFNAASEFANYPNSIVQAHISTKVDKGDYYELSASVYHQKSDNKPTGESYDITLKVLKHAKVHYLDNNLPDIIASDAFSFLKEIGMQKIQQDNDGYVTEFSFALGEKLS